MSVTQRIYVYVIQRVNFKGVASMNANIIIFRDPLCEKVGY